MFLVRELLDQKHAASDGSTQGGQVHTIAPGATVLDAARLMNTHRIGSLVVVDQENRAAGIVTERDILTRVVAEERQPSRTLVGEVMTRDLITCSPKTPLVSLCATMREKRIRHIPVLADDRLIGMVSIGDVNAAEAQTLVETITHLETYISR